MKSGDVTLQGDRIRVLLVDDKQVNFKQTRMLLQEHGEIELVGCGEDGDQVEELVERLKPQVVIMDVIMRRVGGIEATRRLKKSHPNVKVVALSGHIDEDLVRDMLNAGAVGYVAKPICVEDLVDVVRKTAANERLLSDNVNEVVVNSFLNPALATDASLLAALTEHEREVLRLHAEGSCTKDIAAQLQVKRQAIDKTRSRIMEKLKIDNFSDLVKCAVKAGLVAV